MPIQCDRVWEQVKSQTPYIMIFQGTTLILPVEFPVQWILKNVYTEMHAKPVQGNIVANKTNIILLLPSAWILTCQCLAVCRRLSWNESLFY